MSENADTEMQCFDPSKTVTLPGTRCAYCRRPLDRRTTTRDHVVGRKFAPEGAHANAFQLILKTCRPCNDHKAKLEDDISLITMLPDTAGRFARDDERLRRTVERKGKGAVSPATRRLVTESYGMLRVKAPLAGGLTFTYEGRGMPSIDDHHAAQLAFHHVQGFCFFRSFNRANGHGAWLDPAQFHMFGQLMDGDLGNPQLLFFMEETKSWERMCLAFLADGYFRHTMFRNHARDLWAWAVEWNERWRVFGICGSGASREAFIEAMPALRFDFRQGDTTNGFAFRIEEPLAKTDDILFQIGEGFLPEHFSSPHWR